MNYEAADPIIESWGRENSVPWCRMYRDEEVRSADIYLSAERSAQLWLEPLPQSGDFAVCAWDRRTLRYREVVSLSNLHSALDRSLAIIRSWTSSTHAV